jgi:hypothetical protein
MCHAFASFAALALAMSPVVAFADCAPADASLAGHYYLHGVMEVGSELLLKAMVGLSTCLPMVRWTNWLWVAGREMAAW